MTAVEEPVLVDTGPLIAMIDATDAAHADCVEVLNNLPIGKAYTCWPVVTEAAYLLRNYAAQRSTLLKTIANGTFTILDLRSTDVDGVRQIFDQYHDQQIDFADAVLVHLANREDIGTVFTLDRRHFRILLRSNGKPFRLLPDDL